jgi:AcrR family transcriptional regulator
MGRTRTFDETTVLRIMREQFWLGGYHGTSTYDLMDATGLGKGSIYTAYGNKRDLYLKVFTDYCAELVSAAWVALRPAGADTGDLDTPLQRIERYMLSLAHIFATSSPRRACFMSKGTIDMATEDEAVAAVARAAFVDIAGALAQAVRDAQGAGEIAPQADADALGKLLFSVIRGIDSFGVVGLNEESLTGTVRSAVNLLPRP